MTGAIIAILALCVALLLVALFLVRRERDHYKAIASGYRAEVTTIGAELLTLRRQLDQMKGKK